MNKEIEKINKLAEKKKGDRLMKYLSSRDSSIKIAAMKALGKCDGEKGFNTLINALEDSDPLVRKAAAEGLGETKKDVAFTHLAYHFEKELDENVKKAMKNAMSSIHTASH